MSEVEYTDMQAQFLNLLKKYPVKLPETIVDYVTTQGETVLEDPELMAKALAECEIPPVRRRQILKHWFADKGVEVAEDILHKVSLAPDKRREAEEAEKRDRLAKEAKYSVDERTGAIKVATTGESALTMVEAERLSGKIKDEIAERRKGEAPKYVYDTADKEVRMAKADEQGGTLDQAKELKKMAEGGVKKDGGESPFIVGSEGEWTLNPKANIRLGDFAVFQMYQESLKRGTPIDPMEELTRREELSARLKEAMGIKTGGGTDMTMLDKLDAMGLLRKPSDSLDNATSTQIAALQKSIEDMKEERFRDQITALAAQNKAITEKMDQLMNTVADLKKPTTGKTEMDILHEIATEGINLAKAELPGLRGDLRDVIRGGGLPTAKTTKEREERKEQYRKTLEEDKEIEELGKSLFF